MRFSEVHALSLYDQFGHELHVGREPLPRAWGHKVYNFGTIYRIARMTILILAALLADFKEILLIFYVT